MINDIQNNNYDQNIMDQFLKVCSDAIYNPLLEVTDSIMETVLYPLGFHELPALILKRNRTLEEIHIVKDVEEPSLGHPIMLELIVLRNQILQLQKLTKKEQTFIKINNLLRHVVDSINKDKMVSYRCEINKQITTKYGNDIRKIIGLIDYFLDISDILNRSELKTGSETNSNPLTSKDISLKAKKLIRDSNDIYISILKDSAIVIEFESYTNTTNEDIAQLVQQKIFQEFLNDRKALLNISNRRVL